jgi:hypothetical protein
MCMVPLTPSVRRMNRKIHRDLIPIGEREQANTTTKVFGDAVRGREEQRKRWSKPIEEHYREAAKRRASIV